MNGQCSSKLVPSASPSGPPRIKHSENKAHVCHHLTITIPVHPRTSAGRHENETKATRVVTAMVHGGSCWPFTCALPLVP